MTVHGELVGEGGLLEGAAVCEAPLLITSRAFEALLATSWGAIAFCTARTTSSATVIMCQP